MKTLYALCLVTLLAVLVDVVLLHSTTAKAQDTGNYKVVQVNDRGSGKSFSLTGTVVGFSCVEATGSSTYCYALTRE
jgi:hypothetical protein